MARPPKAIEAHVQDGTYRADRHADRGLAIEHIADIKPPKGLTKDARKLWKIVMPPLCSTGLVSILDYPALEEAFRAYGIAQQCLQNVQSQNDGDIAIYLAGRKRMDSNLVNEYLKHMDRFDRIMMKFGMTPVERAKIRGAKKKDEKPTSPIGMLRSAGRG